MSRRTERVASAIREVVSSAILFEMNDPRIRGITVLGAEVSGDLRHAKVFVSIMGDARQAALAMHGLRSARGFLQKKVADRLEMRYTPVLQFVEDDGVKRSLEMAALLREVVPDDSAEEDDTSSDDGVEEADGTEEAEAATDDHAPPTASDAAEEKEKGGSE